MAGDPPADRSGLAAGFCLVFLSAVTELTATLGTSVAARGAHVGSTQFWAYTTNLSYGAAAPCTLLCSWVSPLPYLRSRPMVRTAARTASHRRDRVPVTGLTIIGVGSRSRAQAGCVTSTSRSPTARSPRFSGPRGAARPHLRIIAGFERADRGRVRSAGTTVDDGQPLHATRTTAHRLRPRRKARFSRISPCLPTSGSACPPQRRRTQVRRLIEMVGLTGLEPRYPHQLSGGQQQRVALARALTVDPQVVLLDEPFASIDAACGRLCGPTSRDILHAAGTTTILVTHDQEEGSRWPTSSRSSARAHHTDGGARRTSTRTRSIPTWPRSWARRISSPERWKRATTRQRRAPACTRCGPAWPGHPSSSGSVPAIVLVRPEQVEVGSDLDPGAVAGGDEQRHGWSVWWLAHSDYHGHDVLLDDPPRRRPWIRADRGPGRRHACVFGAKPPLVTILRPGTIGARVACRASPANVVSRPRARTSGHRPAAARSRRVAGAAASTSAK